MTRRERLTARTLPTGRVTLAATVAGGDPEPIELRALLPDIWDALVAQHPPTPDQRGTGAGWNIATFRPALIAASVLTPDGEDPLTEQDWVELTLGGKVTIGELNALFWASVELNDRSPAVSVGKG